MRKDGDYVRLGYDAESDIADYVLDGEGDCIIDGVRHHIRRGDCVFYPKGTMYRHLKGLTLLAISVPPFDRKSRIYLVLMLNLLDTIGSDKYIRQYANI